MPHVRRLAFVFALGLVSYACKGERRFDAPSPEDLQPPTHLKDSTHGNAPWPSGNEGGNVGGGPRPIEIQGGGSTSDAAAQPAPSGHAGDAGAQGQPSHPPGASGPGGSDMTK